MYKNDEVYRTWLKFLTLLQGPVLAWLNCIEAMQEIGMEIPINLKVKEVKPN